MQTETLTTSSKKDLKRAEQLMREYATAFDNKKRLQEEIKNEMDAYNESMKKAEKELIEIGIRNPSEFDGDGNLSFNDGYLHITNNAVIITKKKFDVKSFYDAYPDLIDIDLKKGAIKKAFMDKDIRKELKLLGVDVDNEQGMQVLLHKKAL